MYRFNGLRLQEVEVVKKVDIKKVVIERKGNGGWKT